MIEELKHILEMSDIDCQMFVTKVLRESGYEVNIGHRQDKIDADYIFAYPPSKEVIPVLLMSHWDTVRQKQGKFADEPVLLFEQHGKLENQRGILGADDRAGIAMILEAVKQFENKPMLLFTNYEETGCEGMRQFLRDNLLEPFKDSINLAVSVDRRGHNQYVQYYTNTDVGLEEFMIRLGYEQATGSWTDGEQLARRYNLAHVNVSYGGYLPHTADEFILYDSYISGVERLANLIEGCDRKFFRSEEKPTSKKFVVTPASHEGQGTAAYNVLPQNAVVMTGDELVTVKLTDCPCEVCGRLDNSVQFNTLGRVFLCSKCINRIMQKYKVMSPEAVRAGIKDIEQEKRTTREANVLLKPTAHIKKEYPTCPSCGRRDHVSWSKKLAGFVCTECNYAHSTNKEDFEFNGRFWVRNSDQGLIKMFSKGDSIVEVNEDNTKILRICSPGQHEWLRKCVVCGTIAPIHTNTGFPLCRDCALKVGDLIDEWEDTGNSSVVEVGSEDIPF